MELHDGDIIVFKDTINDSFNAEYNINFRNIAFDREYIAIKFNDEVMDWRFIQGTGTSFLQATYNGQWMSRDYITITIYGDQTITDENFINWLYENTVSGLPPRIMENMYAVVGDQIQYSFSNIGDVVGSIVNNGVLTIFTLGIFIVSLAVGLLRRISRRKNFK